MSVDPAGDVVADLPAPDLYAVVFNGELDTKDGRVVVGDRAALERVFGGITGFGGVVLLPVGIAVTPQVHVTDWLREHGVDPVRGLRTVRTKLQPDVDLEVTGRQYQDLMTMGLILQPRPVAAPAPEPAAAPARDKATDSPSPVKRRRAS